MLKKMEKMDKEMRRMRHQVSSVNMELKQMRGMLETFLLNCNASTHNVSALALDEAAESPSVGLDADVLGELAYGEGALEN